MTVLIFSEGDENWTLTHTLCMYCQLDWPVCASIGTCLTKYAPKVLKKSCVLLNPPCSEPALEIVLAMELGWK